MANIYRRIRKLRPYYTFIANEGSLEATPIFGPMGPSYYTVIWREPINWFISMWKYEYPTLSFTSYLQNGYYLGTTNFFTRRICGTDCVLKVNLTVQDFVRAKSMLEQFDLILILEENFSQTANWVFDKVFPNITVECNETWTTKQLQSCHHNQQEEESYNFKNSIDIVRTKFHRAARVDG